jgi:hemoglobin-like flavoprotein
LITVISGTTMSVQTDLSAYTVPTLVAAFFAHIAYKYLTRPSKCPFLTDRELQIVQESWKTVSKLGAETVGVLLFKNIFSAAPSALDFFSFKDEPNFLESRAFKKHAVSVVNTVGVAVGSLEDLATLVPILKSLGEKHAVIGTEGNRIVKAHYDLVGAQLLVCSGAKACFLRNLKLNLNTNYQQLAENFYATT